MECKLCTTGRKKVGKAAEYKRNPLPTAAKLRPPIMSPNGLLNFGFETFYALFVELVYLHCEIKAPLASCRAKHCEGISVSGGLCFSKAGQHPATHQEAICVMNHFCKVLNRTFISLACLINYNCTVKLRSLWILVGQNTEGISDSGGLCFSKAGRQPATQQVAKYVVQYLCNVVICAFISLAFLLASWD